MNERIRELRFDAGIGRLHGAAAPYLVAINKSGEIIDPIEGLEKFAELLIRECANQCTTEGPFVAEVVWGKQFHKKIKEHFGVEE